MTHTTAKTLLFGSLFFLVTAYCVPKVSYAQEKSSGDNWSSENTNHELLLAVSLTELVSELNKQTPIKVDADTRLDSVSTFSKYMIYNNTLTDIDSHDVDPKLVAQHFNDNVISQLCYTETFKPFIDLELVMVYRYLDKNGKLITELSKDLSGC